MAARIIGAEGDAGVTGMNQKFYASLDRLEDKGLLRWKVVVTGSDVRNRSGEKLAHRVDRRHMGNSVRRRRPMIAVREDRHAVLYRQPDFRFRPFAPWQRDDRVG